MFQQSERELVPSPQTPPTPTPARGDNTSDSSSISSQNDLQHSSQSDEFLKLDSKGIAGKLERIPLTVKLLTITAAAGLVILVFAVWLVVLQGITLNSTNTLKSFSDNFSLATSLVSSLQFERSAFTIYIADPIPSKLASYLAAQANTNGNFTQFMTKSSWEKSEGFSRAALDNIRNSVSVLDPVTVFGMYVDYVRLMINIISNKAKNQADQPLIIALSLYVQYREAYGMVRVFGALAFANKNVSLNEKLYDRYHTYYERHIENYNILNSLANDRFHGYLQDILFTAPEYVNSRKVEAQAMLSPVATFSVDTDVKTWTSNTSVLSVLVGRVFVRLSTDLADTMKNQYASAIGLLVTVIILAILFVITFAILSFCLSRTIIGPWVRMNRLQEEVIHKFVPRHFLRMLNVERITDAKLGTTSTKQQIMMQITINNYWHLVDSASAESRVDLFNRIVTVISPVIKSYGGYLESFKADEITVYFRNPQGCLTCAHKVHKTIFNFNSTQEHNRINISIAIHGAQNVHMGFAGDENHMQGIVLSKVASELRQIVHLARRFKCKTIISNTVLDIMGEKRKDIQVLAMHSSLVLYELVDSELKQTREIFSKSVRDLFVEHNVFDAIPSLQTINSEAARFYLKVCYAEVEAIKRELAASTIEEMIRIPELESILEIACEKEKSVENLLTYKSIVQFEQAFRSHDRVIQTNAISSIQKNLVFINITENLRTATNQILSLPIEHWNVDMFAELKTELMMLMKDTYNRAKQTDEFRKTYAKKRELKNDLLEEMFHL